MFETTIWCYRIPRRFKYGYIPPNYADLGQSEFLQLLRKGRMSSEERFEQYVQKRQVTQSDFLRVRVDKTFKEAVSREGIAMKIVFSVTKIVSLVEGVE